MSRRLFILLLGLPTSLWCQTIPESIAPTQTRLSVPAPTSSATGSPNSLDLNLVAPSQTRLILAQSSAGAEAAASSQTVANQPNVPKRTQDSVPPVPATPPSSSTTAPPGDVRILDPRLDTRRPKNCQLTVSSEQTLSCGETTVVLPAATYEQKLIMGDPEEKTVLGETSLKSQKQGLGFIRYGSDVPLKINGVERTGGLDVPVRMEDNLPVRVWYRKMTEPDDITKVFTFILPPVGLVAGAGAWASGNILIPDKPPVYMEARDYYLKPLKPKPNPQEVPQPSHLRPLINPESAGPSQIRSK